MSFALALLQKGSAGIGGFPPVLQPDVSLSTVTFFAALNPAVILVAILLGRQLGRRSDQTAKLGIAAFAAAIAGAAALWIGAKFGVRWFATAARAAGGIFVASCFFGFVYAALAYWSARPVAGRRGPLQRP